MIALIECLERQCANADKAGDSMLLVRVESLRALMAMAEDKPRIRVPARTSGDNRAARLYAAELIMDAERNPDALEYVSPAPLTDAQAVALVRKLPLMGRDFR